jgi:uncharacterized protein YqiB (DUF1249 family)
VVDFTNFTAIATLDTLSSDPSGIPRPMGDYRHDDVATRCEIHRGRDLGFHWPDCGDWCNNALHLRKNRREMRIFLFNGKTCGRAA